MMLTVTVMRSVLSFTAVYVLNDLLGYGDWALLGAWLAALADMIVRMILFMRRYNSGRWHFIKV